MSKARTLADFISDGSEFADGTISVAEVSGAAPLASPSFTADASFEGGKIIINEVTGGDAYSEIRKTNTGSNFAIVSPEALYLLVDSNNDQTNRGVVIGHNAAAPGSATSLAVIAENGTVFNEPGANIDFRVESDNNANMIKVDASQNNIGIGKSPGSGQGTLQIAPQAAAVNYYRPAGNYALFGDSGGNGETDWIYLSGSYTNTGKSVGFAMQDYNGNFGNYAGSYIRTEGARVRIGHFVGGANSGTAPSLADNFTFDTAGGAVFNERGETGDFRVESDAYSHIMFVDASENRVSIGHNSSAGYGSGHVLAVAGGSTMFSNFGADNVMQIRGGNYTDPHTASILLSGGTGDNGYVREWYVSSVASGGGGAIQNDLKFRYVAGGSATQYEALKLRHNGEVIVNDEGWGTHDFRVEADSNSNAFKVDAGENSGQGAVLVGTGSMFGTGNTDYIAHTMTQAASTTPMLVNGAMFAMPDIPSGKQAQAGRWKFGGFKNHWYPSAGTRVDSSLSQLVVEISGGASGKTNMELFELGFNRGWDSRFVMIEVFEIGYINGGYKKYMFHGGYDPSFTLYENYGNNSISLNVLAEGPFQNGTSSVSSSTVDQSYYRKTVRATLGAYYSGHIVVTIPSFTKITNNTEVDNPYLMRLLNPQ